MTVAPYDNSCYLFHPHGFLTQLSAAAVVVFFAQSIAFALGNNFFFCVKQIKH